ncbi:down syndrome cell adhesion molecule [Trichonephila clavipes]|nr:down syndrome cell adhesion molecule [Trichonephila clavipes]
MTAATMNLVSWHDGGCPITSFLVRYRQQQDIEWIILNDGPLPPDNRKVDLVGLSPGSWYQIHISATNLAGTTDAEYTFSTLNTLDAVTPKTVVNKVTAPFYLDMTIILPVAVSAIVILIVLIVVCFVVRKKHSSEHYGTMRSAAVYHTIVYSINSTNRSVPQVMTRAESYLKCRSGEGAVRPSV